MILTIIEVLVILLTVITLMQFSKKNIVAWLLSLLTNCLWMYIGIVRQVPVIIIATSVYTIFNIRGYLAWRKDEPTQKS